MSDYIKLQRNRFPLCSVNVKEKNGKKYMKNSTIDNTYKCCNNLCSKFFDECVEEMSKKNNREKTDNFYNINSCYILADICNKNCESSRYNFDDRLFDSCLLKYKCADSNDFEYNDQCLIDNRENIKLCCIDSCNPTSDKICRQHCNTSFDIHLERAKRNRKYLEFLENNGGNNRENNREIIEKYKGKNDNDENNNYIYIFIIMIGLLLCLVYYF